MRLPWVSRAESRARLAELSATWDRERQVLREDLRRAIADSEWFKGQISEAAKAHADLLSRFTMLRLQGATDAPAAPAPREPVEADPLKQALRAKFTGVRRGLLPQAMAKLAQDRARGVDEVEIMKAIEQGETVNDGVPG